MTGKAAIHHVAGLRLREVLRTYHDTTDATVRLVCEWRLSECGAFEKICRLVGAKILRYRSP